MNCCPTGGRVTAAQELLVDAFMAGAAIARGQVSADHKAVVIDLLLARGRLVAVQAVDALFCVGGHFVFVHHGILEARMALRAFARCPDEIGCRLIGFNFGPGAINKKCRKDERECNNDS